MLHDNTIQGCCSSMHLTIYPYSSQVAGERHIPKCLSIRAKPKMLMKGSGIGIGLKARNAVTNLRGTF